MCQGLSVIWSSYNSFATSYSVIAIARSILLAKNRIGTSLILIAIKSNLGYFYIDGLRVSPTHFLLLVSSACQLHLPQRSLPTSQIKSICYTSASA